MVSTQSDGVDNLIDVLCGRLPSSVPVQLPGARPLRMPGILNEIVRDRGDFGEDTRETVRLTEALMNVLTNDGTTEGRCDTPANARFKDYMGMISPLILEYDDVSARQYERIREQETEIKTMREQLEKAKSHLQAMLDAERARDVDTDSASRNGAYGELQNRVLQYETDNELLRQQIGIVANEVRELNVELKQRKGQCANLERELQNYKVTRTSMDTSTADGTAFISGDADFRGNQHRPGASSSGEDFNAEARNAKYEVSRLEHKFADLRRRLKSTETELSDSKEYVFTMENCLRSYQQQSLEVYKQVKAAVQATERATIQRDQAFTREKALADEVFDLRKRFERQMSSVDEHVAKLSKKRSAVLGEGLKTAKRAIDALQRENAALQVEKKRLKDEMESFRKSLARSKEIGAATVSDSDDSGFDNNASSRVLSLNAASKETDEMRYASRQKATEESVRQRLRHAEESLMKQQEVTAEMEASASRTIQILREKLRRSRRDVVKK